MKRSEFIRLVILRSIGNFLVLFSIYGVIATFGQALSYELRYRISQARGVKFVITGETEQERKSEREQNNIMQKNDAGSPTKRTGAGFMEILAGAKVQTLIPEDPAFSLVIPKIGASAKVFPNIDPGNPNAFLPILQHGIAHARGSVFPGMPKGNIYLFAHSVDNWWNVGRYNAVFYLLKDLTAGDEVVVFFENRRYDYVVTRSVVTEPGDVSFLAHDQNNDVQLVMQTCWPPGTTWKRLYVIATPKSHKSLR